MRFPDEWVADNLPPAWVSYSSIFGGWFILWMLSGFSGIGFIAAMLVGPFLGWGLAILAHQALVAAPRREEDERRGEEFRARERRRAEGIAERWRARQRESDERQRLYRLLKDDPERWREEREERIRSHAVRIAREREG